MVQWLVRLLNTQKIQGSIPRMSEECGRLFIWMVFSVRSTDEYNLNCVIGVEVSLWLICIRPRVVILAGVKYRSRSESATVGITMLTHASETGLGRWSSYSSWELSLKRQDTLPPLIKAWKLDLTIPESKKKLLNFLSWPAASLQLFFVFLDKKPTKHHKFGKTKMPMEL